MWIAIVDMDQRPHARNIVVISDEDGIITKFASTDEIEKVKEGHNLEVFDWWGFDVDSGDDILLSGVPR